MGKTLEVQFEEQEKYIAELEQQLDIEKRTYKPNTTVEEMKEILRENMRENKEVIEGLEQQLAELKELIIVMQVESDEQLAGKTELIKSQSDAIEMLEEQLEERQWQPIKCNFDEQDYTDDIPDFSNDPILYKIPKRFCDSYIYADRVDDEGILWHDQEKVGVIFDATEYLRLPLPAAPEQGGKEQ